jgi:hypothetical protein
MVYEENEHFRLNNGLDIIKLRCGKGPMEEA